MPLPDVLPPLARTVLDRLLDEAARDSRMVGVAAGGSAVTGTMDAWSDVDLVLVARDGEAAAVLADAAGLAARLGPLLSAFTGEHVGEPRLLIALYGPPLLHVDLKVVAVGDLADRVEDPAVLWERGSVVRAALATSAAAWPAPDGQWIEDRFWVWIHYAATKLARGELFECLDVLAYLRATVLGPLIAVEHGQRPQGVRRIERFAPERAAELTATIGGCTSEGCASALRAAAGLYRALRDPSVARRVDAEREALAFLDDVASG